MESSYAATYHGDSAILSLQADRRFSNIIITKDGRTIRNEGAWRVVRLSSDSRIIVEFSNFAVLPSFAATEPLPKGSENVGWVTEPSLLA